MCCKNVSFEFFLINWSLTWKPTKCNEVDIISADANVSSFDIIRKLCLFLFFFVCGLISLFLYPIFTFDNKSAAREVYIQTFKDLCLITHAYP